MLNYFPRRRGAVFYVIDQVIATKDIKTLIGSGKIIVKASLAPHGQAIDFRQTGGHVEFTIPEVKGHQMLELRYT